MIFFEHALNVGCQPFGNPKDCIGERYTGVDLRRAHHTTRRSWGGRDRVPIRAGSAHVRDRSDARFPRVERVGDAIPDRRTGHPTLRRLVHQGDRAAQSHYPTGEALPNRRCGFAVTIGAEPLARVAVGPHGSASDTAAHAGPRRPSQPRRRNSRGSRSQRRLRGRPAPLLRVSCDQHILIREGPAQPGDEVRRAETVGRQDDGVAVKRPVGRLRALATATTEEPRKMSHTTRATITVAAKAN